MRQWLIRKFGKASFERLVNFLVEQTLQLIVKALDKNKDGVLTVTELKLALDKYLPKQTENNVLAHMESYAKHKKGGK